ncbi:hypothetical protein [Amphibacillus jilinensis]|uniref:hypothetical protein n=1 Tax=Amphibacillus jilinensis TaxID=1216008 RepID=UPI0002D87BDE|nr:hypothetical protein [Amphibacillus jilinensis]
MKGFLEITLNNELILIILSSGIGATITHFFYKKKLKNEQRMKFQNIIGDKIIKALLEVREIEIEASVIERYDIVNGVERSEEEVDMFGGNEAYPSIFNSKESVLSFLASIQEARSKHEKNLDCETSVYLWYMERYIGQLILFLRYFNEDDYPLLGMLLIKDIKIWRVKFHRVITKKINNYSVTLQFKSGLRWDIYKKIIMLRLWNNSILNKINNDSNDEEIVKIMDYIVSLKEKYHKPFTG